MSFYTEQIYGVWKLVSFNIYRADDPSGKPILQPLGESPLGRIIFLPSGYMNVYMTSPGRAANIASPAWHLATEAELAYAAKNVTMYCGPFEIYEENGETRVDTHVDVSLDPSWIGSHQIRRVEGIYDENERPILTLTPLKEFSLPDGTVTIARITWEKVKNVT
ncbi:Lipocalin-like domain-containing protein [Aspergillus pseudoustus]|uniref:Lipocalin-like domain-containing protein n=1 Tax=Aspergillus pseudoustus TaxID=1810923 RepID=A0ABR4JL03_9EURO